MRFWKFVCWAGAILTALAGLLALTGHLVLQQQRHIAIRSNTTVVTAPRDAAGYVDFYAAINNESSAGVTSENNAAIPLLRVIGPGGEDASSRDVVLRALGLRREDVSGKSYVNLLNLMTRRDGESDGELQQRALDLESVKTKQPWHSADEPLVAEWLRRNEEALQLLREASLRTRFFEPLVDGVGAGCLVDVRLPHLGRQRELANILGARAMMRLGDQDMKGWEEDVLTLARYGRLTMQRPMLIEQLVGLSILGLADQCAWAGLDKIDAMDARQLLRDLRALPPVPELANSIDQEERLVLLSQISAIAKYGNALDDARGGSGVPPPGGVIGDGVFPVYFAHWMEEWNKLCDIRVAGFRQRTYSGMKATFAAGERVQDKVRQGISYRMGSADRAMGRMVVTLYSSVGTSALLERESGLRHQFTELGLLLAANRQSGGYPASLSQLDQKEMAGMDDDFFSGGKLIYRREGGGYVLYSVGRNAQDDGGLRDEPGTSPSGAGGQRRDDLALHVN